MQGSPDVLLLRFAGFGDPIHSSPIANDALDVVCRQSPADLEEPLLGVRSRHASQRADLGVRELAASERLGQQRQCSERTRHAYTLTRRAEVEPDTPAQPGRTGPEAVVPTAARVELADQIE